jgi:hypothetical protein
MSLVTQYSCVFNTLGDGVGATVRRNVGVRVGVGAALSVGLVVGLSDGVGSIVVVDVGAGPCVAVVGSTLLRLASAPERRWSADADR